MGTIKFIQIVATNIYTIPFGYDLGNMEIIGKANTASINRVSTLDLGCRMAMSLPSVSKATNRAIVASIYFPIIKRTFLKIAIVLILG